MTDSTDVQPILDYTARDFDTIRSLLVGIAKGKFPEWVTVGEANDFGTLMLELYAYMGDISNYYIDRVSSEAFLGTAQRRQSVLYIAEMLGYKPIGQQAATVVLKFTLDAAYDAGDEENNPTNSVTVPSGTIVTTNDQNSASVISFETDFNITLLPGETVEVTATEGLTVEEYFGPSENTPNYTLTLANKGVIFKSTSVRTKEGTNYGGGSLATAQYVNWTEIDAVSLARPTQSVFSTYIDDTAYTHVLFGDGGSGRIPPGGAEIRATYRYGVGALGNEVLEKTITIIRSNTLPIASLSVTNPTKPLGGSDPESMSSMRFSIPKANQVKFRAVTLDDYLALAIQVPGVAKAMAYGQVYSAVNVRIAPVGGVPEPSQMAVLRNDVATYLADKVLIGSSVYVEDVQWTDMWIDLDLFVMDGFNQEQITQAVQLAIENFLSFDNRDFGGKVSVGDIYRQAMTIEGVDYVDVKVLRTPSTSGIDNRVIDGKTIARIHPETVVADVVTDPYGLTITSYGGLGAAS